MRRRPPPSRPPLPSAPRARECTVRRTVAFGRGSGGAIVARSPLKQEKNMVKVGDVAPAFKVKNHKGQDVELSKLKGKTVVLWFYPKADTPGCTKEGCAFRDRQPDFSKLNAVLLGV